jgi:hypothetical protein
MAPEEVLNDTFFITFKIPKELLVFFFALSEISNHFVDVISFLFSGSRCFPAGLKVSNI